ncbi:MAG: thiamine-phosphate kinase [Microbacterium sp.]|uniref:thiamine-phosphate kinase n=1 Tax=Microbacterium sp. TaxID=51671 RepID=UPI0039E698EF
MHARTVGQAGETEVLRRILARLAPSTAEVGPGDDAAVLRVAGGRVVASTDTLVHGPDFRLAWSSGHDLGWKAAAVNLADIAAMGARPIALLVALTMPDDTPVAFVEDLADGLRQACLSLAPGCAVEGGDLAASDTLTIAVTALGTLDGPAVRRSGARPGDIVALAGHAGLAAHGLQILFERFRDVDGHAVPVDPAVLTPAERRAVAAQVRPEPPIALGHAAAHQGATAMMDVSDGLVLDATRLAIASRVCLELATAALGGDPLALIGGEDHALLATFPRDAVPAGFRAIGRVTPHGAHPVLVDGEAPTCRGGWDPYSDWDQARG